MTAESRITLTRPDRLWGKAEKKKNVRFGEGNNGVRRCMEQVKKSKGAKGVDAEEEEKKVKSYSAKKYEGSVEEKRKKSAIT